MSVESVLAAIPEFETNVRPRAVPLGMTAPGPARRPRLAWAAGLLALLGGGLLWGSAHPAEQSWQVAMDDVTYTVRVQGEDVEVLGLEFQDGTRRVTVSGGDR